MKRFVISLLFAFFAAQVFSQSVQVISPNGGENWIMGCPYAIQWVTSAPVPVKIELYRYASNSTPPVVMLIAGNVPAGMSTFTWIPPNNLVPGNLYKVKITSLTNTTGFDFSDNLFSITTGTITVVSPNGGENWYKGGTYQIFWTDNLCTDVRIEIWKGGVFHSVIAAYYPSSGSYTWTIPDNNTLVPGNDYKVKIKRYATNATTTEVYDFSDNNFTILGGYFIKIISPNGGEIWIKGTTHIITWQDNIPWDVRIELWKGGMFNSLIAASVPSNGSCYWAIPATVVPGNDYKVKILALLSPVSNLVDFSDNNFTILGVTNTTSANGDKPVVIYPNPVHDIMHLQFRETDERQVNIELYDLTGQKKIDQTIDRIGADKTCDVNTSGQVNGIYMLIIRQGTVVLAKERIVIIQ
jgi:hypothetical protein